MKILSTSLLALAFPALAHGSAAWVLEPQPAALRTQVPVDKDAEFRTKFRQALEINAKEEIAKLVRAYNEQGVAYVIDLCALLPSGGSERVEKELAALREAWKTAFKSAFVERMYNYFSLIDPRALKELDRLNKEYNTSYKKFDENRVAKDSGVYDLLAERFEFLGKGYEEQGYQLFAARSYNIAAVCLDSEARAGAADLNRAADNFGACVRANQAFDITDSWAMSVKARFESLTREGKGAAAASVPGASKAPSTEPVVAAPAITAAMRFEALPSFDTYLRPNYFLDDFHILWPQVYLQEKGTSGAFQALEGTKVKLLRIGAAALSLDLDGDGKGDQEVPAKGNRTLVQFAIGEGDEKRDWAVVTEVGTDKESYQGLQVNYQANDQQFQLYVMSGASMVGTVNETPVRVIDDNMDGFYGSQPKQWQYAGLPAGTLQSDIDSIVVGSEKRARPWSEYCDVGGSWFKIQPLKGGRELLAEPTTLETGKLKLEYKGDAPDCLIVQGQGPYERSFFDLQQNGGAEVTLPAGKYQLYFGILRKGKKLQMSKALILPGKRTPSWTVTAGETTTIPMGAPYGFEFDMTVKDNQLTVQGASVTVIGSQGERYERPWNCVPRPELLWRKAGTKRASKPERFGIIEDLNAADEEGRRPDPGDTFHPLDLSVEVKLKEGEGVEAQLIDKKNKLFGAIESAWHN